MYRVLLTVDAEETRAKQIANAVAELPIDSADIEVTILNVLKEFDVTGEGARVRSEDVLDVEEFPESVSVAAEELRTAGLDAEAYRESGKPANKIIEFADEIDADLIAIGGRRRSPTGKVLFGSVTQSVMLSTDRPVLTVMSD